MSKHTPGPWEFVDAWVQTVNGKKPIAEFNFYAATEANASLIAAAPELLEALKVLCNSIETVANPFGGSLMHNMARAAIAKAEGKQ